MKECEISLETGYTAKAQTGAVQQLRLYFRINVVFIGSGYCTFIALYMLDLSHNKTQYTPGERKELLYDKRIFKEEVQSALYFHADELDGVPGGQSIGLHPGRYFYFRGCRFGNGAGTAYFCTGDFRGKSAGHRLFQ